MKDLVEDYLERNQDDFDDFSSPDDLYIELLEKLDAANALDAVPAPVRLPAACFALPFGACQSGAHRLPPPPMLLAPIPNPTPPFLLHFSPGPSQYADSASRIPRLASPDCHC